MNTRPEPAGSSDELGQDKSASQDGQGGPEHAEPEAAR